VGWGGSIKLERNLTRILQEPSMLTLSGSPAPPTISRNSISPQNDETFCSICSDPIHNYTPKFFENWPINPACTNCDDENESNVSDNIIETLADEIKDSLSSSVSVANIKTSIVTSIPPSMVSHWTPITQNFFQNPGSLTSMVTHCYFASTRKYIYLNGRSNGTNRENV
jgi:hypothetical protein